MTRSLTLFLFIIFALYNFQGIFALETKQYSEKGNAEDRKKIFIGVWYFKKMFGHVHQTPNQFAGSLTTLSCGHPVKIYQSPDKSHDNWELIQAAGFEGYILKDFLSQTRPDCFQQKYSNFFNSVDLDLTDLYFWGRLYDQYFMLKTEVSE